jgi:hypothetical protein
MEVMNVAMRMAARRRGMEVLDLVFGGVFIFCFVFM